MYQAYTHACIVYVKQCNTIMVSKEKGYDITERPSIFDTPFQGLASSKFTFFHNHSSAASPQLLHAAALNGNATLLKPVLERHIPVDVKDEEGTTALILASRYNHYECVELLLKYGADPNAQRQAGVTSLCYAALGGYVSIVKLLLKYGADIEACGMDGSTPFILACECNHSDIAEELFSRGADIERTLSDNTSAIFLAAQNAHTEIITFLASRGADVNARRSDGVTALWIASQLGYTKCVQELIRWGADFNLAKDNGDTPLHASAHFGYMNVIKVLIEAGCNPCVSNKSWERASRKAELSGHTDVTQYLLKKEAERLPFAIASEVSDVTTTGKSSAT